MKLFACAAACLALGCLSGCTADRADAAGADAARIELTAQRGLLRPSVLLTGQLEAVNSEKILVPRTPVWQIAIRWMEPDGTLVQRGQRVLELDSTNFSADLEQKRLAEIKTFNDLDRKEAELAVQASEKRFALDSRRVELEKARLDAAIPEALVPAREHQEKQLTLAKAETEHRKALEELETSRVAAAAELDALRIGLERARAEILEAERAIAAMTLIAPRDGILIVAEKGREGRKFQVGDNVWVGLPVMSIPDLAAMKVVARLSDVDDGNIAPGSRVRCTLDTYPDEDFEGRVTEIAPIAQEESDSSLRRSFRVEILLERSDPERMRPGMSVLAEVLPPPRAEALLVPRSALDLSGQTPRVLLADGGARDVRLGACDAMRCVVEHGLDEGTRLRRRG